MAKIMTTKELAEYLKLHEITICKYAAQGKIPAVRIGRVWRFDKDLIDKWITGGQDETHTNEMSAQRSGRSKLRKKRSRKKG